MIRFTHVSKSYPRTGTAVDDVSLNIGKGEFLFFTGPSGAGKTTLLKMVYMEERPTTGEVRVSGTSSITATDREVAKLRRKLGIIFQDFRLLDNRTAEQNVAFALEVTGVPVGDRTESRARAHAGGSFGQGTAYPRELSGEQQRVAIARAGERSVRAHRRRARRAISTTARRVASSSCCARSTPAAPR